MSVLAKYAANNSVLNTAISGNSLNTGGLIYNDQAQALQVATSSNTVFDGTYNYPIGHVIQALNPPSNKWLELDGSVKTTASYPKLKQKVAPRGTIDSPTGTKWGTVGNLATIFGSNNINDVASYTSSSGVTIWVAVGANGTLATSQDGQNWTARTSSFGTTAINAVVATAPGTLTFWVIVGAGGLIAYANPTTDFEPTSWTQVTSSFGTSNINAVAANSTYVAAVGDSGKIAYALIASITSWTQVTSPFSTSNIYAIGWDRYNYSWSACGQAGKIAATSGGSSTPNSTWSLSTGNQGSTDLYTLSLGGLALDKNYNSRSYGYKFTAYRVYGGAGGNIVWQNTQTGESVYGRVGVGKTTNTVRKIIRIDYERYIALCDGGLIAQATFPCGEWKAITHSLGTRAIYSGDIAYNSTRQLTIVGQTGMNAISFDTKNFDNSTLFRLPYKDPIGRLKYYIKALD